jgi:hypothetical protein
MVGNNTQHPMMRVLCVIAYHIKFFQMGEHINTSISEMWYHL